MNSFLKLYSHSHKSFELLILQIYSFCFILLLGLFPEFLPKIYFTISSKKNF
jgi:hypothetical protein